MDDNNIPTTDEIRHRVDHGWEPYGDGSFDQWLASVGAPPGVARWLDVEPKPYQKLVEEAYQRGHEDGYWNGKTTDMSPAEAAAFMAPYRATAESSTSKAMERADVEIVRLEEERDALRRLLEVGEGMVTETIATAEELNALPVGSVVLDADGVAVQAWGSLGDLNWESSAPVPPVTVLHRPDATPKQIIREEWGVILDDAGSTDMFATRAEAAAHATQGGTLVQVVTYASDVDPGEVPTNV